MSERTHASGYSRPPLSEAGNVTTRGRSAAVAGPGGHGRPQRHARLASPTAGATPTSTPPSRTASACTAEGADLVDVGGESTRPGAERVDAGTEAARVLPVIRELAAHGVPMSIDTTRAERGRGRAGRRRRRWSTTSPAAWPTPTWPSVVADAGCPWVLMHWRGHSRRMADLAVYADVVTEVRDELRERVDDARRRRRRPPTGIILDPGLGFAKTRRAQLAAHRPTSPRSDRARLSRCCSAPAASPTSARLLAGAGRHARDRSTQREAATVATSVLAVAAGAWGVRVHDVRATVDALAVWRASGRPALASRRMTLTASP